MKPKIKICGLRDPENIRGVLTLQPDYIGFIFYPASKRFVGSALEATWVAQLAGVCKTGSPVMTIGRIDIEIILICQEVGYCRMCL